MSIKNRNDLKLEFVSGTAATQDKFADVFDSHYNKVDDSVLMGPIGMTATNGLWLDSTSAAPSGPSASGEQGQIIYEEGPSANYLYICVATNSWIRVLAEDTF
jgi:hypothetical protein